MLRLENIVTMDKTMVCHHTPEIKKISHAVGPKGTSGPYKGKGPCQQDQEVLFTFLETKDLIYSHIVPKGLAVNGKYICKVLGNIMKQQKKKRPMMVEQE